MQTMRMTFALFQIPVGTHGHYVNVNTGSGGLSSALVTSTANQLFFDPPSYVYKAFEQGNGASVEAGGPLLGRTLLFRTFIAGGGGKLVRRFSNYLAEYDIESELAFIDKRRPKGTHNVAVATEVVGEVSGRTCLLVDDMIDTAGTVVSAAELLISRGAREVMIAATHGLLSGPAVDRLKNAPIREVIVTDTLPILDEKRFDALRVLSIAPLLSRAIDAVFSDESVSGLFGGDNL